MSTHDRTATLSFSLTDVGQDFLDPTITDSCGVLESHSGRSMSVQPSIVRKVRDATVDASLEKADGVKHGRLRKPSIRSGTSQTTIVSVNAISGALPQLQYPC